MFCRTKLLNLICSCLKEAKPRAVEKDLSLTEGQKSKGEGGDPVSAGPA